MNFYFESAAAFWHMDGHGPYVWASYAVTIIVFLTLAIAPRLRKQRLIKQQRALAARQQVSIEAALEVDQ